MKNEQKILQRIGEVAKLLRRQQIQYSRADLAFELSDYGIVTDSTILDELIFKAYKKYNFAKELFVSNDKKHYVVDEYEVHSLLQDEEIEKVSALVKAHLHRTEDTLSEIQILANNSHTEALESSSSLISAIKGTSGIERVRKEADFVFTQYANLINAYNEAHSCVDMSINDFLALRKETQTLYLKFASSLVDIFGDSIKIVAPQLFDFSNLQWIDVSTLLAQSQLEYSNISAKCSVLINEISEKFSQSLQEACSVYKSNQDKRVGLALGALGLVNHYLDTADKTTALKTDLLTLKKTMRHDASTIKSELMRVAVIYKTLNDVFVPKALWFTKYASQIFTNELHKIEDEIYGSVNAKKLLQQRNNVIEELTVINQAILDLQKNMQYYNSHIEECKTTLKVEHGNYQKALNEKPQKPFFLWNILSLGALGKNYRRDLYQWTSISLPIIQNYDELEADIKLDKEDLRQCKNNIKTYQQKQKQYQSELQTISNSVRQIIVVSSGIKTQLLDSLQDYIRLLSVAKDIVESKLDQQLIRAVSIRTINDIDLPTDVTDNINSFISSIQQNIVWDDKNSENLISSIGNNVTPAHIEQDDLHQVTDASNVTMQKGMDLCKKMIEIQRLVANDKMEEEFYQTELCKLQQEFSEQIKDAENASELILSIASQLSSSENNEDIKNALFQLSQNKTYSKKEIEEVLKGERIITI